MQLAIGEKSRILYSQGYGLANIATSQAVSPSVVFQIGSITKQFTAALVLKQVAAGTIGLDTPVLTYLPASALPAGITIRNLLNQDSGLQDYVNFSAYNTWITTGVSESTVIAAVAAAPVLFSPGAEFSYSSSNFFILGSVLEAVTGSTYDQLLQNEIIGPLNLSTVTDVVPPNPTSAAGYLQGTTTLAPVITRSSAFASFSLSSNANDLVYWLDDLQAGNVLPSAFYNAMITPPAGVPSSYGFGIYVGTLNGRPYAWHDGHIQGFSSFDFVFLDDGFAVALLANDGEFDLTSLVLQIVNAACNVGC
jgi:CubicO group peptidase (beta-lactamase class C family)